MLNRRIKQTEIERTEYYNLFKVRILLEIVQITDISNVWLTEFRIERLIVSNDLWSRTIINEILLYILTCQPRPWVVFLDFFTAIRMSEKRPVVN